jgi:hypothetical protein
LIFITEVDVKKQVEDLLIHKRKIANQLKDLQEKCTHDNQVLKSVPDTKNSSSFSVRWVCVDCHTHVRYPTQEELKNWKDE